MNTAGLNVAQEIVKALFSFASAFLILVFTWLFGQRLSYQWNVRQKRREFQLMALQQFYVAYGEFFAVWKLWNRLEAGSAAFDERRWELHKRAAAAEAIVESTLVKLSSELHLEPNQLDDLGCFRQAFQQLRQSIRENRKLPWMSSEDAPYRKFKTLAIRVAGILGGDWPVAPMFSDKASDQLLTVTSNRFEADWVNHP